ncbi:MAG TPA: hypothetical protein VES20_04625 [Bryobacteraceae bacterium]|nr:hypothetical protein [Bryobacteraceae bacterium]
MYRIAIALLAFATVVASAAPNEQKDFSGQWKMDTTRSESAHHGVPIGSVTLFIQQTATELRVKTITNYRDSSERASTETLAYNLNGSENLVFSESGVEVKTRARREGAALVTEAVQVINGAPVTAQHVLNLAAGGKELTIDKTLRVQHGYQAGSGNNTGRGRDVFVRVVTESRGPNPK